MYLLGNMSDFAVSWSNWECPLPVGCLVTCRRFQEDFHKLPRISQHNSVCSGCCVAWSTWCPWAALALQHPWLVAGQEQRRAGCVCRMAPLHLPGNDSPEWSCAQLIQCFSEAADYLHALSVGVPEFSRHTAASTLQRWLSWVGWEVLGKHRSPQAVLVESMSLRKSGW